jgi:3-dehydroquinate synthase
LSPWEGAWSAFVQIPTTILSQVDSSVGGKVGVNHPKGKNVIGSFYQPRMVCIDPGTLETLPPRERWSGLAEAVKYGLIADQPLFELLEENIGGLVELRNTDLLENVLFRCCQIKAGIVEKDETEDGLRRNLNFGHTIGHAVEARGGFNLFRHGEAITAGMLWAVWVSEKKGYLDRQKAARIRALLKTFPLPPGIADIPPAQLREKVKLDKKQSSGGIHLVLLNDIGSTRVEKSVLETWMIDEGWKNAIS